MKKEIVSAVLLTVVCIVFFSGAYSGIVWLIAQAAPNHGNGFVVNAGGKTYYENIAQNFTGDQYFWSRPSAVNYNAAGSGGSNKGPANPDYLAVVQQRIDTFMAHNPGINKSDIPVDMVTASGSGLDPNISVQGAMVQAPRIAAIRGLNEISVKELINRYTESPLLGIFGPEKVNVLKLNMALDGIN